MLDWNWKCEASTDPDRYGAGSMFICSILKIMNPQIPEYRHKQLAEALTTYGFRYDDYKLRLYSPSGPDSAYYFFESNNGQILVFYTEDYVDGLDHVKNCLSKNIFATIKVLHKAKKQPKVAFEKRRPVASADYYEKPKDAEELMQYAVDFASFDFGFLASVEPVEPETFWKKNADLDVSA